MESSSMMITNQSMTPGKIRLENPFSFKVGQVFTGFGFGCGVGIGIGKPLNLGAIPMLGQVMSATRGATDALSGVGRHVNNSLRKVGAKNIEAGIGCGVGFGHGFGIGLAVKPSALHQAQSSLMQAMTNMMTKFGVSLDILGQRNLPAVSLQSGIGMTGGPSNQSAAGPTLQGQSRAENFNVGSSYKAFASKSTSQETPFVSRTEQVISNFMRSPILSEGKVEANDMVGHLQSENSILQMVLKHQQLIEELKEENEKLRQILTEDLNIPSSRVHDSNSMKTS